VAPIAVGLIGAGKHGARYASHIGHDVPDLRLAALSRRDPAAGRRDAERFDCRFHPEWSALVGDPTVDAVIAVVPPALHPPIAAAVAAAGKPLLIEKPLARTGAAAVEIVAAVRRAGIPVLMAHTLRWNVAARAVRARMASLGPLRALQLNQRFEPSPLAWLDDPEIAGGGIILHTGVHAFDLARWLTEREVTAVTCRSTRVVTRRTEDNFVAVLELAGSDAIVSVSGCRATAGRSGLIDVACEGGQLVADHVLGFAYEVHGTARSAVPLDEPVPTVREVLRSFVRLVRDGEPPGVDVEDGARAVLVAEACLASAASGARAAVPSPAGLG
jgi:predicted dehydrogenase